MTSPPPYGVPARRRRPSTWWFALGGGLLLAAVVVFGLVLWRTISSFSEVDATVPADGRPHEVSWSGEGRRMLWEQQGQGSDCTVATVGGGDVSTSPVTGSFTRSGGGVTWVGVAGFDAPPGGVEVTCAASAGPAQVGPYPNVAGFVGGILVGILLPLLLGLLGLTVIVVTSFLLATGEPRRDPGAPRPPDGPAR